MLFFWPLAAWTVDATLHIKRVSLLNIVLHAIAYIISAALGLAHASQLRSFSLVQHKGYDKPMNLTALTTPWLAQTLPVPPAVLHCRGSKLNATSKVDITWTNASKLEPVGVQRSTVKPLKQPTVGAAALTKEIAVCRSLHELKQLQKDHGESINCIHVSAFFSTAVKLRGSAGKGKRASSSNAILDSFCAELGGTLVRLGAACGLRELSNSVWALAKLGRPINYELLSLLKGKLAQTCNGPDAALVQPQSVSNLLWSLATWSHNDAQLIGSLLFLTGQRLSQCNAQDLANTVWAMARLRVQKGSLLHKLWNHAQPQLPTFTPQALSNLAWGLSVLDFEPKGVASALHPHVKVALPRLDPQALSNLAVAIGHFGKHEESAAEAMPLALLIQQHVLHACDLGHWPPQALVNLLHALAMLEVRSPALAGKVAAALARHAQSATSTAAGNDTRLHQRQPAAANGIFGSLPPAKACEVAAMLLWALEVHQTSRDLPSFQAVCDSACATLQQHASAGKAPLGTVAEAAASLASMGRKHAPLTQLAVQQLLLAAKHLPPVLLAPINGPVEMLSQANASGAGGRGPQGRRQPPQAGSTTPHLRAGTQGQASPKYLLRATVATLHAVAASQQGAEAGLQPRQQVSDSQEAKEMYENDSPTMAMSVAGRPAHNYQQLWQLLSQRDDAWLRAGSAHQLLQLVMLAVQLQATDASFYALLNKHLTMKAPGCQLGPLAEALLALASIDRVQMPALQVAANRVWALREERSDPRVCVNLMHVFAISDAYSAPLFDILAGQLLPDAHTLAPQEAVTALWSCALAGHYDAELAEALCQAARSGQEAHGSVTDTVTDSRGDTDKEDPLSVLPIPSVADDRVSNSSPSHASIEPRKLALSVFASTRGSAESLTSPASVLAQPLMPRPQPASTARNAQHTAGQGDAGAVFIMEDDDADDEEEEESEDELDFGPQPYPALSSDALCKLSWAVAQLGSGLFLHWRLPAPAAVAQAVQHAPVPALAVMLWSLAVAQLVLTRTDPWAYRLALRAVIGRLATLPINELQQADAAATAQSFKAAGRRGGLQGVKACVEGGLNKHSRGSRGSRGWSSVPGPSALALAEAVSLLLACPSRAIRHEVVSALRYKGLRHLGGPMASAWRSAHAHPAAGPLKSALRGTLQQMGLDACETADMPAAANRQHVSMGTDPRVSLHVQGNERGATRLQGGAGGSGGGSKAGHTPDSMFGLSPSSLLGVPSLRLVLVLAQPGAFASNVESHALGPLFTLVQLLQARGWRARLVDVRVWQGLCSDVQRQQYLAQCLQLPVPQTASAPPRPPPHTIQ